MFECRKIALRKEAVVTGIVRYNFNSLCNLFDWNSIQRDKVINSRNRAMAKKMVVSPGVNLGLHHQSMKLKLA